MTGANANGHVLGDSCVPARNMRRARAIPPQRPHLVACWPHAGPEGRSLVDELTVIGVDDGAVIVVSSDGARYRIPITDALHTALRQHRSPSASAHRVSPREIQALIRGGMSAEEVADRTGEDRGYIERFEGPVLAEREYVITAARAVAVTTAAEGDRGALFGPVIDARLEHLMASDVRWSSRKVGVQWEITVRYREGEIDRSASWTFDPKRGFLSPRDHDAQALSEHDPSRQTAQPRLRAVADQDARPTRFDSGAFASAVEPVTNASRPIGDRENPSPLDESGQTADLLDALRRRRGEREAAATDERESSRAAHPSTGSIRIVELPLDTTSHDTDSPADDAAPAATPSSKPTARRGRAAMPTWDEIVFGARPDDDPA